MSPNTRGESRATATDGPQLVAEGPPPPVAQSALYGYVDAEANMIAADRQTDPHTHMKGSGQRKRGKVTATKKIEREAYKMVSE